MSGVLHGITAAMQPDPYWQSTSLLLRMNGANDSTTFTDSSRNAFSVTRGGNAKISTSQSKSGGASAYMDGNGDYVQVSQNSAFDFGSGDFCIELWVYSESWTGSGFGVQMVSATSSGGLFFGYRGTAPVGLGWGRAGVAWDYTSGHTLALNQWHHLAFTRASNSTRIFVNGSQVGTTQTYSTSVDVSAGSLRVGAQNADWMKGFMDDVRITKGQARYTANFTPPGPL